MTWWDRSTALMTLLMCCKLQLSKYWSVLTLSRGSPVLAHACSFVLSLSDSTADYTRDFDVTATSGGGSGGVVSDTVSKVRTDMADESLPLMPNTWSPSSADRCTAHRLPGSLANVTVLLGVFHRPTGAPVVGVINQPFAQLKEGSYRYVTAALTPLPPVFGISLCSPIVDSQC